MAKSTKVNTVEERLVSRYVEIMNQIEALEAERDAAQQDLADWIMANPGKNGRATYVRVRSHNVRAYRVRAHSRSAYAYVRC